MILSPVKAQLDGSNITDNLPKSSCHTNLNYSKPYMFILQKVKKPPNIFCTHLLFASAIIAISICLFLHRISRLIKVKLIWIRVTTAEFSRKASELGGRTQIKLISVIRQERSLPKTIPKLFPFYSAQFLRLEYTTDYLQKWNPQNKFVFDYDGSSVILYNSANDHI